ncbi:MAG: hypothetical protein PHG00_17685 [Methylococcales bacterium]|nr:hypothetical protein [Methylococcales bacterium]
MPTAKKHTPKCIKCPKPKHKKISESMLQDFVQHKTSVFVIMAGALSLGALFAMMLGVSAAHF